MSVLTAPNSGPAKPPAAPSTGHGVTDLAPVVVSALASWIGGVALHAGWHVNVPFLAAFLVLILGHLTVGQLVAVASRAWHFNKLAYAGKIAVMERSAEVIAEQSAKDYLAGKQAGL